MISVIILTKNEEDRIQACLESVQWADEIVIADNGSSDKTLEIAKKYTDKIVIYLDQDFASLRNKATEIAKGDWILYVDADERVLDALKEEILQIIDSTEYSAYAISRRNIIFGQEKKYGPFWPDWVIRLIKKEDFENWVGKIHEQPQFKGKLGYSHNSFLHLTHRDVNQIVRKSLDWANIDVKLRLQANHPPMSGWRFLRILFTELFNQGIRRKGFFAGTVGVMDSLLQTFSLLITYMRLWELQQNELPDKKYKEIDNSLIKNNFRF